MQFVLGAVLILVALFWAINQLLNAAGDTKAAARRLTWSRKYKKRVIDNLHDPREAAAILVCQTAAYEGELTAEQTRRILAEFRACFRVDEAKAQEFLAIARHALSETADAGNNLTKLTAPIRASCSATEITDLLRMMHTMATFTGEATDRQTHLIDRVKRALAD